MSGVDYFNDDKEESSALVGKFLRENFSVFFSSPHNFHQFSSLDTLSVAALADSVCDLV